MTEVSADDIAVAAERIAPFIHRTPVMRSGTVDRELGTSVFFKAENFQKVGAFKVRGAINAIRALPATTRGVVTHSSGNHGQALAYAAAVNAIPAWVVMPEDASEVKRSAVRGYGAQVVPCHLAERQAVASRVVNETGATFIHPFDDPRVIAGQGTAAHELLEDVPGLDVLLTPIGGGGLLAGTAIAGRSVAPGISIVGAEPTAVDDAARSLRSGVRQPGEAEPKTIADGLLTGIGALTFPILLAAEAEVVTVTEDSILAAATFFLTRMKILVEPSAATVLAALRTEPDRFRGRRVGAVISGGNTDLGWLRAR